VPFIRRTRDKRGYETTYVMHAYRPAQGPHRTRILYVFRSPAGSRIGRAPLDGEVQEALDHTHPDLTFDWQALLRESAEAPPPRGRASGRGDLERQPRSAQRPGQPPRQHARDRSDRPPASRDAAPALPVVVSDDHSTLGQTLGAAEAARLRARYGEVLQRIARRSRTPDERDRLVERARRLNPDDWSDEGSIRVAAVTVEAEWLAIVAELPARRRGRRGGRRRGQGRGLAPGEAQREPGDLEQPSGIIEDEGSHELPAYERANRPDPPDDAAGDGGGIGSESAASPADSEPASDVPGDD
jgi:hypothetical protein